MKKLLAFTAVSFSLVLNSQNREISFEHGDVASVLAKAKKENKLIFIDAYTSWCGPCKWMASNVFTNDTVADYFNKNFVNYKLDMEKGEGVEMAKKYDVRCYPNLLFIDGDGKLVHRGAGGMLPKDFIAFAGNSMLPGKNFISLTDEFEKKGLNEGNILAYTMLLGKSCLDATPGIKKYLGTVKDADLQKRVNWVLIRDYVHDLDSREIKYLVAHSDDFSKKFGKDTVEGKLANLGQRFFDRFYKPGGYNREEFEKAKKEFISQKWPGAQKTVFTNELTLNKFNDKAKFYELAAAHFQEYYNNDPNSLNAMAWEFYQEVDNKEQLKAAVNMAKRATELGSSFTYMDTYAGLLYKTGNYKEAEKQATKAIESAKKSGVDPKEAEELLRKIKEKL
jgi:thioredoxin-related protein